MCRPLRRAVLAKRSLWIPHEVHTPTADYHGPREADPSHWPVPARPWAITRPAPGQRNPRRSHTRLHTPGSGPAANVNPQRFPTAWRERPRAAARAGGEVGGGGGGGDGSTGDAGRRANAVGELRGAHRGACEHRGAHSEHSSGRDGADGALVRALRPPRTVSSPPKSCPKSPPGGLATRGSAPCAKTALSRSHSVGAIESGERRARHTTVTRAGRRHGGRSRRAPSRGQRGG